MPLVVGMVSYDLKLLIDQIRRGFDFLKQQKQRKYKQLLLFQEKVRSCFVYIMFLLHFQHPVFNDRNTLKFSTNRAT